MFGECLYCSGWNHRGCLWKPHRQSACREARPYCEYRAHHPLGRLMAEGQRVGCEAELGGVGQHSFPLRCTAPNCIPGTTLHGGILT
jgi:hypothetical protein